MFSKIFIYEEEGTHKGCPYNILYFWGMRKWMVWMLLVCACCAFAQVRWLDYGEALAQRAKDGKPVFVDHFADWCVPCVEMQKTTFKDKRVARLLNTKFHPVRLDTEAPGTLLCEGETVPVKICAYGLWEASGLPAFLTVNPNGEMLRSAKGGYEAEEFLTILRVWAK
jgi:thioredoxin-related protein